MNIQTLALAFMAATAIGGVAWVFLYPILSGEKAAEQRRASFTKNEPVARRAERAQRSRRQQVEDSLKEVEDRTKKAKNVALTTRIAQAGLTWSKQQFIIISAVLLGLPDAVDIIVRGIKAGLPLFDSIKVVAVDAPEPVKSEFAAIVETQAIGMPLGDACARLYERMPVPEANFFGIVISIQQKAGGNLSEALGNLSKVLRDRKKMKAKIKAMSMEAKASAAIIGSMPPVIMMAVYALNPEYISLLWTTPMGRLMLAGSAIWMTIGILVMKKMINFDF
jgi:tight adherence protein B